MGIWALFLRRPDWLIEGILESGSFGMLYGSPSSGKSFSALDMGACVATGLDWHGNAVQQGGVLYFVGEGMQGVGRRKDAWTIAHEIEFKNSMFFATQFVDLKDRKNSLPGFIEEIRKLSQKTKVKLLIMIQNLCKRAPRPPAHTPILRAGSTLSKGRT